MALKESPSGQWAHLHLCRPLCPSEASEKQGCVLRTGHGQAIDQRNVHVVPTCDVYPSSTPTQREARHNQSRNECAYNRSIVRPYRHRKHPANIIRCVVCCVAMQREFDPTRCQRNPKLNQRPCQHDPKSMQTWIMHPTACIMHHAACIMNHAPRIMHHVSCMMHDAS